MGWSEAAHGASRSIDAAYAERVLGALPGAVFVIDGVGRVKFATAPAAALVERTPGELVGMSVLEFVSEESAWMYAAAVAMATDYADVITGPLRVTFTAGGEERRVDVWATNRLDDPGIEGIVCLVNAETAAVWLGEAMEAAGTGAPPSTIASRVVTAMRGHPVAADAIVLSPTPDGLGPVVPTKLDRRLYRGRGPWHETLATGSRRHVDAADLGADLQQAATTAGYEALWVEPVLGRDSQVIAVLLLWKARPGGPSPNQLSSIHQAAAILRLCWPA
ncbi:MAG: PAS domain-containing protein [Actinobacteria bacterium]|nr:PAS domain-containing protein [Actinomycetota bacterium]